MNNVKYILENKLMTFEQKVEIKKLGRSMPDLQIKSTVVAQKKENLIVIINGETTYGL